MKLLIVGATGRTGRTLTEQAVARGHEVTVIVRDPATLRAGTGLRIVAGDPLRIETLTPLLSGQDAVISCLGQRSRENARLLQDAAAAMLTAMNRSGVRRYISISQGLLFPNRSPVIALLRLILARIVADSTAMERLVRASETGWTIVRAPRLLEGGIACGYRIAVGARPEGAGAMQRTDLAAFLLDEAEQAEHIREIVGITSG